MYFEVVGYSETIIVELRNAY